MKTYSKYEGLIKSKEAAEAIAAPVALCLLYDGFFSFAVVRQIIRYIAFI